MGERQYTDLRSPEYLARRLDEAEEALRACQEECERLRLGQLDRARIPIPQRRLIERAEEAEQREKGLREALAKEVEYLDGLSKDYAIVGEHNAAKDFAIAASRLEALAALEDEGA